MTVPHKTAICKKHGETDYYWCPDHRKPADGFWTCLECSRERGRKCRAAHPGKNLEYIHRVGKARPMSEAKDCTNYLGIVVAERALSKFFDNIKRMPNGTPGYDFICGKGFKIDVKSSCLVVDDWRTAPRWQFRIRNNKVADYFLCLAFDNREHLEPQHVWLIPGAVVNHLKSSLTISSRPEYLKKWERFERPLDRVVSCCTEMVCAGVV